MTPRQRWHLLLGLLGLWAVTSVAVFGFGPEPERVPLQNVTGTVAVVPGVRGDSRSPGLQVNLALFEEGRTQRAQGFSPPRNIFLGAVAAPGQGRGEPHLEARNEAEPITADPQPGADASTQVQYLGLVEVGTQDRRQAVAVLASGDDLLMVRTGERIENRLLVTSITPDAVTVIDAVSRREQRLPASEVSPSDPSL